MSSILDEMLAEAEGKLMEYEYVGKREPVTTSTSDTARVQVNLPAFVIQGIEKSGLCSVVPEQTCGAHSTFGAAVFRCTVWAHSRKL